MKSPRIAFHHFGCKVNFAEASSLARQFRENGYEVTPHTEQADIYVISSCMVTAIAEKKCRAAIRQAHALNPNASIAVIGCLSELKAGELASMEGVNLILGHEQKFHLFDILNRATPLVQSTDASSPEAISVKPATDPLHFTGAWSRDDRTRSFLKIQDGCDYHCAYCTIPLARGRSRSATIAEVVDQTLKIGESGIREIVLTGVNIGDFGKHTNETLLELLQALETSAPVPRIRISSIEPDLLHPEIIQLVSRSRMFLPHFHLPLQAGSDAVLTSMKRRYSTRLYHSRVMDIKHHIPDACIAADVIVGFPGETEEQFSETVDFLTSLPISYLHVFSYSRRENTLAGRSEQFLPSAVIKERSNRLRTLSDQKKTLFYDENGGKTRQVLFESDQKGGYMHGFTENYIHVKTPYHASLINTIRAVILLEPDNHFHYSINIL